MRLKNCYIVKDYNKEKKIVACKICNTHSKLKIGQDAINSWAPKYYATITTERRD